MLQDLALNQLMLKQMLPYLRAGAAAVPVAVDRAGRVMAELSSIKGLIQGTVATVISATRRQASNYGLSCDVLALWHMHLQ